MIDKTLQKNILSLVEENNTLSLEYENIKVFLETEKIKPEEIDKYRNNSILQLLFEEFMPIVMVVIFIGIIYVGWVVLTTMDLGLFALIFVIPAIFFTLIGLISFWTAFAYLVYLVFSLKFEQIVLYCITILVLYLMNISEWFILIATILFVLFCRFHELSKRQKHIKYLDEIEQHIQMNYNKIINLSAQDIIKIVHRERMADVNSIHAHGFSFLPAIYIHDILNQHLHEIEKIPLQNNTILYKSKINSF